MSRGQTSFWIQTRGSGPENPAVNSERPRPPEHSSAYFIYLFHWYLQKSEFLLVKVSQKFWNHQMILLLRIAANLLTVIHRRHVWTASQPPRDRKIGRGKQDFLMVHTGKPGGCQCLQIPPSPTYFNAPFSWQSLGYLNNAETPRIKVIKLKPMTLSVSPNNTRPRSEINHFMLPITGLHME